MPESRVATRRHGDHLQLTYLRRHDSGLVYLPKFTSDLKNWSSMLQSVSITDLAVGWEEVTVTDAVPIGEHGRRFGMVEVLQAP